MPPMAGHALRLSHRASTQSLRQCKFSCLNFHYRTLTSATPRSSSSPTTRLPRPTPMGTALGNATMPELVMGAGGKAPGFVQQMLFSAPVQEKNAKEQINHSINALLGGNTTTNSNTPTVPSNPSLPPFKFH